MSFLLYSSCLCSDARAKMDLIINSSAIQKFHSLLLKGFIENGSFVTVISSTSIKNNISEESYKNVEFNYISKTSIPLFRQLTLLFHSFLLTRKWLKKYKEGVVVVDVLNISISLGTLLACRLYKRKVIGIVTDVPNLLVGKSHNLLNHFIARFNNFCISQYDYYVFLTDYMNDLINMHKHPYIIMEGLVDSLSSHNKIAIDTDKKILLYAGGLYVKYGIRTLLQAFHSLLNDNYELHLYGSGEMDDELSYYTKIDKRIKYFGLCSNEIVLLDEYSATALINPRPSNEEFAKYSFPSKNMEYMISGTPLITSALPGMPKEYYPYVYLIDDESSDGIAYTINKVLSMNYIELFEFGLKAKSFVLENKNNIKQAKRILDISKVFLL